MGTLSPLLIALFTGEVRSVVVRTRHLAIYYAMAALFGLFALAGLVVALFIMLARRMPPEYAALAVAGLFLALALIVLVIASVWSAREKNRRAERPIMPQAATVAALGLLPALLSNKLGFGLVSAAFAGYLFTRGRSGARPGTPATRHPSRHGDQS